MKRFTGAAVLLLLTACRAFTNYQGLTGPRFAADLPLVSAVAHPPATLRVVTYNVQWARHIDRAIAVLQSRVGLAGADIITLQEMDDQGTQQIAAALGMAYVYYPAGIHPKTGKNFGNAILSRWPIVTDEMIELPHLGRVRGARRIATAATVLVGDVPVRVYSVHLGTPTDIGPAKRRDQVRAVLVNALRYGYVVIGGDMNSRGIGSAFRAEGFDWPTEHNHFTATLFNWDHIFFKGFTAPSSKRTGVVRDTLDTSDHDPVWAVARLP